MKWRSHREPQLLGEFPDVHTATVMLVYVMMALGLMGKPALSAVPHIAPYLKDKDPYNRAMAAWALRVIDSPDCSQHAALTAALDDPDATVAFIQHVEVVVHAVSDGDAGTCERSRAVSHERHIDAVFGLCARD